MKRSDAEQQNTVVFSLGDWQDDEPVRGHLVDDDTKELPLIAGRFIGREWHPEEVRRETEGKSVARKPARSHRPFLGPMVAAALAFLVLTGSLAASARPASLREETVTVSAETVERRAGESEYLPAPARSETVELSVTRSNGSEDRATVLAVRRGRGFSRLCRSVMETVEDFIR